jgi:putative flippase GtrA
VGAVCAVTANALLILGDWAGVHYAAMSVVAFVLVTPAGYVLHASITFRKPRRLTDFLRFASGVATGLPISLLMLAILCSGLRLPVSIGAPVTTVLLIVWNYCSTHLAIRHEK